VTRERWKLTSKLVDVLLVALLIGLAIGAGMSFMGGCASSPQGGDPSWPPEVELASVSVSGSLELSTPAGPVTVALDSGLVSGQGAEGVRVTRAKVAATTDLVVYGRRQVVTATSPGSRVDDAWAQCVELDATIEVLPGVAVLVHAVPPGLPTACGPAVLEVGAAALWQEEAPGPQEASQ
jgi:hypothetical protein